MFMHKSEWYIAQKYIFNHSELCLVYFTNLPLVIMENSLPMNIIIWLFDTLWFPFKASQDLRWTEGTQEYTTEIAW